MLREGGFNAILDKLYDDVRPSQPGSDETVTKKRFKLKYSAVGDDQTFLESFQQQLKLRNVYDVFDTDIAWDKIGFNTSILSGMTFTVEFADVEFEAELLRIDVARKYKKGVTTYTYTLSMEKAVDINTDAVMSSNYLRRRTKNMKGKTVAAEFPVIFTPYKESNSTNNLSLMA